MAGTLPVDDTTLGLIGRFSPGERQLAVTALVLVILGSASLLVAAISHLRQRRKP